MTTMSVNQKPRIIPTVHRWVKTSETREEINHRCDGHCAAVGRHDRTTGALVDFDAYGQLPQALRVGYSDEGRP